MSSILTNNSAMVALQTLNSINSDLRGVQDQISTGKAVGSAKDNSAVWAISSVMKSDVEGFNKISESLSLGASTVAVGRQAAETTTDLLTEIKGRVVAAQEDNVDRSKIQTDIASLRDQITAVVDTAQFNGLNLLKGQEDVEVLSSLDRSSDGTVDDQQITVKRQDLSTTEAVFGTAAAVNTSAASDTTVGAAGGTSTVAVSGTIADGEDFTIDVAGSQVTYTTTTGDDADAVAAGLRTALNSADLDGISAGGTGSDVEITSTRAFEAVAVAASTNSASGGVAPDVPEIGQRAETIDFTSGGPLAAGDSFRVNIDGTGYDYVAASGDTYTDVASGLKSSIDAAGLGDITTQVQVANDGSVSLAVDNSGADVALSTTDAAGGTAAGGLRALAAIDVSDAAGAEAALDSIEGLIQTSIDAAAEFGSVERRIEIQSDFVGKISDALTSGIGSLVDANMEEASARLQALQVQQQLGVQALSIANQAPQSILSLFR